jgi:alpha-glucosidase
MWQGQFELLPLKNAVVEHSPPWWQRAIIYQIYPLSFQDSTGDGKGDLGGILSRMDYLTSLGIDAVWLGPIYPSPMADFGYDITDFTAVDPVFGSLLDLDRLIEALHVRGIRFILDFVPNHTSDMHPWFRESRSSRQSPKRDWYVWSDPSPHGGPPNNWLSRFGGSAWEWDPNTGQYYYHAFLKEQPDLNWRNPQVRAAMADVLRFWLRRGVDGFRVDAAAVLAEDVWLRDEPPNPDADERTPPPERFKRVYTDCRPEVLAWLADLRAVVDEFPDRLLLGEVDTSPERVCQFYGDGESPIIHLPLNYRLLDTPWNARRIAAMVEEYLNSVPKHGWPNWVIGSHDKKRIASNLGSERAAIAALLLFTLPGTPIFYAGDELGMRGGSTNSEQILDPFERQVPGYGLNRDPERTPMQWDGSANAGFTTGTPWLPIACDHLLHNFTLEHLNPGSMLNLYRRLIALRHEQPALRQGDYGTVLVSDDVFAYCRSDERQQVLIVLNLSSRAQHYDLPGTGAGHVLLSTQLGRAADTVNDEIDLGANEGVIIAVAGNGGSASVFKGAK